jgi:hypothetical protein
LARGQRIAIPTHKTYVLNKWLAMPGARLVEKACALSEKAIIVFVEFPEPEIRENADILGIDIGINKLITTSDRQFIGTDWKSISARVCRCRPRSKGKRRACVLATGISIIVSSNCRGSNYRPSVLRT